MVSSFNIMNRGGRRETGIHGWSHLGHLQRSTHWSTRESVQSRTFGMLPIRAPRLSQASGDGGANALSTKAPVEILRVNHSRWSTGSVPESGRTKWIEVIDTACWISPNLYALLMWPERKAIALPTSPLVLFFRFSHSRWSTGIIRELAPTSWTEVIDGAMWINPNFCIWLRARFDGVVTGDNFERAGRRLRV